MEERHENGQETLTHTERKLTKEELLKGTSLTRYAHVPALGGTVAFRALNAGEKAHVDRLRGQGVQMNLVKKQGSGLPNDTEARNWMDQFEPDMKLDMKAAQAGEEDAKWFALAKALSVEGERWTEEEAKQLPSAAADDIVREVYQASGVDTRRLDRFRRESGGEGDNSAAPDGVSAEQPDAE